MKYHLLIGFIALVASGCGGGSDSSSGEGGGDSELLAAPCSVFSAAARAGTSKVINGTACATTSSPVGRLDLFDDEDNRGVCTASMITDQYAVTAAHCFSEVTFRAELVLNGSRHTVRRFYQQPGFNQQFVDGRLLADVAVIQLSQPVAGTPTVSLDFSGEQLTDQLLVFGYGATQESDGSLGRLNPLVGGVMALDSLSDRFVFATYSGAPEANVCFGDSGGPAILSDRVGDGRPVVVGITSTGTSARCAPGDTNAFTRLSAPGTEAFIRSIVALP